MSESDWELCLFDEVEDPNEFRVIATVYDEQDADWLQGLIAHGHGGLFHTEVRKKRMDR